jgi:hypothetical protein
MILHRSYAVGSWVRNPPYRFVKKGKIAAMNVVLLSPDDEF